MSATIDNQLNAVRNRRGISAADLAQQVGISRQTIYAIEANSYVPNTAVALKLAQVLAVPVEELFSLPAPPPATAEPLLGDLLSPIPASNGQAVRICQVGTRQVCIPVHAAPYYLPEADGVITLAPKAVGKRQAQAHFTAFPTDASANQKLVLAGCDPAIGLVARLAEKLGAAEVVSAGASSKLALTWLQEGKVHIAGSHLEDQKTGEFNLPYLRRHFPQEDFAVVSFARWEAGFVVAHGNPKGIRRVEDLLGKSVRFVNREVGAGSRGLLDRLLSEAGMAPAQVPGYDRIARGHLAVAYLVMTGEADACIATSSAAQAFQLDFVPLRSERYDFVMRRETASQSSVVNFLDVLQRATLRQKLNVLAGYDTAQTGKILA